MADDDQVPFQIQSRDPVTGQVRTTTGTGRRAIRPPAAPLMPDMSRGIIGAYQNLPVEQAQAAVAAAIQYQAQRGYQRDIQAGIPAAQALVRWGPMLFKTGTGMPEALKLAAPIAPKVMQAGGRLFRIPTTGQAEAITPTPSINPYQQQALDYRRREVELREKEAAKKTETGLTEFQKEDLKDAYKELEESRKAFNAMPAAKKDNSGVLKALRRIQAIEQSSGKSPTPATDQSQSSPFKEGQLIRSKRDGKTYKVVNGQPVLVQ